MPTAQEVGEHEMGTPSLGGGGGGRGSPREISEFLALLCASLMGFMRIGPDFSHDFLLEKIFLGA